MRRKCSIGLLILFVLVIYGICFTSIKTYPFFEFEEFHETGIEARENSSIIQNKMENAYEISNEYITGSHEKKTKEYNHISDDDSKFISGLFKVPEHFKHYITESITIMENNSSLVQKAIIQYLNSKDGVK